MDPGIYPTSSLPTLFRSGPVAEGMKAPPPQFNSRIGMQHGKKKDVYTLDLLGDIYYFELREVVLVINSALDQGLHSTLQRMALMEIY